VERTFVVTHNDVPKSLNAGGTGSRRHWSAGADEKKAWEGVYAFLFIAAKIPRGMTSCKVEATIRWKRRNHRDKENFRPALAKPLADSLVHGGWLPDDTEAEFDLASFDFEYPEVWEVADPRVRGVLVLKLTATYDD